jgi:hypothetical protein
MTTYKLNKTNGILKSSFVMILPHTKAKGNETGNT